MCALAVIRRRTHIPGAGPANGSDRGAAIWKSIAGYLAVAHASRSRVSRDVLFGHPLDFERLSHVAVNLQILFVRDGNVSRACSPNEQ